MTVTPAGVTVYVGGEDFVTFHEPVTVLSPGVVQLQNGNVITFNDTVYVNPNYVVSTPACGNSQEHIYSTPPPATSPPGMPSTAPPQGSPPLDTPPPQTTPPPQDYFMIKGHKYKKSTKPIYGNNVKLLGNDDFKVTNAYSDYTSVVCFIKYASQGTGTINGIRVFAPRDLETKTIGVRIDGRTINDHPFVKVALYTNLADKPDTLLAANNDKNYLVSGISKPPAPTQYQPDTFETTPFNTSYPGYWNLIPIDPVSVEAGRTYWIAIVSNYTRFPLMKLHLTATEIAKIATDFGLPSVLPYAFHNALVRPYHSPTETSYNFVFPSKADQYNGIANTTSYKIRPTPLYGLFNIDAWHTEEATGSAPMLIPLSGWKIIFDYKITNGTHTVAKNMITTTKANGLYLFSISYSKHITEATLTEVLQPGWFCITPGSDLMYDVGMTDADVVSIIHNFDTYRYVKDHDFVNSLGPVVYNQSHDLDFLLSKMVDIGNPFDTIISKRYPVPADFDILLMKPYPAPLAMDILNQKMNEKSCPYDILNQKVRDWGCPLDLFSILRLKEWILTDILIQNTHDTWVNLDSLVKGPDE